MQFAENGYADSQNLNRQLPRSGAMLGGSRTGRMLPSTQAEKDLYEAEAVLEVARLKLNLERVTAELTQAEGRLERVRNDKITPTNNLWEMGGAYRPDPVEDAVVRAVRALD